MTPRNVFRALAVTEAVTWVCLLTGMFVKYVVGTTEVGVQVAGPVHGVAFIAYCLATVVVAVDQQWSRGRLLLGLASSVPPLLTLWFDRHVEKRDGLDDRWHSRPDSPTAAQRGLLAARPPPPGDRRLRPRRGRADRDRAGRRAAGRVIAVQVHQGM